jgi:hypothetical protein
VSATAVLPADEAARFFSGGDTEAVDPEQFPDAKVDAMGSSPARYQQVTNGTSLAQVVRTSRAMT